MSKSRLYLGVPIGRLSYPKLWEGFIRNSIKRLAPPKPLWYDGPIDGDFQYQFLLG